VHNLEPNQSIGGKSVVQEIVDISETKRDDLTIILAGYEKGIEANLMRADPGLRSR